MGCVPQVDPDQRAPSTSPRHVRPLEVLEVIDHSVNQGQAATQRGLFEQADGEDQPSPEPRSAARRYTQNLEVGTSEPVLAVDSAPM
jgi:hypothetical protein